MSENSVFGRSYAQLCGIAAALDVIGDRWTPLIVRDLLLGPLRFGDLADGLPGIGTNTLAVRLKHLEHAGVVQRRPVPLPDRGTVYELTGYGRELEPIMLALGRWGTKSMGRLPSEAAANSRWLATALLAFRDERRQPARPTTWELRLSDGTFAAHAEGNGLTVSAGPARDPDLVITTDDATLLELLTRRLNPEDALADGRVTLDGDSAGFELFVSLFDFNAPGHDVPDGSAGPG